MPVFGTIASRFNDDGVTAAYQNLLQTLRERGLREFESQLAQTSIRKSSDKTIIVPAQRRRYLAEIADTIHAYHDQVSQQTSLAREIQQLSASRQLLAQAGYENDGIPSLLEQREEQQQPRSKKLLENWPEVKKSYSGDERTDELPNGKSLVTKLTRKSLSGSIFPRVALPDFEDHGELLKFLLKENLPGHFPFTAGVFPFKREGEDPARMFAGEGDPFRTNRRFKALSEHSDAKRLSTAFDSVTLYLSLIHI